MASSITNISIGPVPIMEFSFSRIFRPKQPEELELKLKHSVFQSLSMRDIRCLCRIAKQGKCEFSDRLMKAGEENENLYLLTEGACLIRNGGKFFAEVDEGHFLGEISHFNRQPVSVDVISRGNVEFLSWDRNSLEKLFTRRPGLQSRFYNILVEHMAKRLQSATEKIVHRQEA